MDYDLRIKTHSDGLYNEFDCLELTTLENGKKSSMLHVDLSKLLSNVNNPKDAISLEYWNKNFAPKTHENTEKALSFDCLKSPEFIILFVQAMQDNFHFLDPRSSVEGFVRIMTSSNLELMDEKVYLACHTNEFQYYLKYLRPFFKSLTNANIERSGLFISNNGNLITATCLYSSKLKNQLRRTFIDTIFHRLIVKYC